MPALQDPVHWVDPGGRQVGPEPLEVLLQRYQVGQIPASTLVWWEGADGWTPLQQVPTLPPDQPVAAAADQSSEADPMTGSTSAALVGGLTDQELDDTFMDLVGRSEQLYREAAFADSIGDAVLGGAITALLDCGFVLIDLTPAPHQLRFEEPQTFARVTLALRHLAPSSTGDGGTGHRAAVNIGYGERVPDANQVGPALRRQSTLSIAPEPGTVRFEADMSSGYVYAQIELLLELEHFIDRGLAVDHEVLRRQLASVIHTLQSFVQARLGI